MNLSRIIKFGLSLICGYLFCAHESVSQLIKDEDPFAHTFSIVARDPLTGEMGVAVQSHWFTVGNTVPWAEPGVGVVATQGMVNFEYGTKGLALLKSGLEAQLVLDSLLSMDPAREMRQVAVLDRNGNVAVNTGSICVEAAGHKIGNNFSVQANFAANPEVWGKMAEAFESTYGGLAVRMLAALEAAQAEGGDIRGRQSASILIVSNKDTGKPWIDRKVDLRVDDHENPVQELKRLYKVKQAYDAFNLGNHFLQKGDLTSADVMFKKAQTLYPDNPEMLFWYAVELANMNYVDKALDTFKVVFEINDSWKTTVLPRVAKAGILNVNSSIYDQILSM